MALQTKDFAVTGKSSGGGITYTYLLRVTENSISIAGNTSNLTVQAILKQSYSGTAFSNWNTGVSCSLGGKEIFSDYRKRRLDGTAEHIYYTWTGDVAHDPDGTLQLTVGGSLWQSSYAGYSPPAMTVAGEMALTDIPRASQISAKDAVVTGVSQVTVSRYDAGFTHSIRWEFQGLSGYLTQDGAVTDREAVFAAEAVDFPIPESFYEKIPAAPDGRCTLECTTYREGTAIGSSCCHFTVRADEGLCAPSLTASVEDCNRLTLALTGDPGMLVAGCSHALCSVTAQAKNGATVVSVTAGGLPADSGSCVIEAIETGAVEFCVTDSRGFTTRQTVSLPLIPYIPLRCNPSVKRTDPTSGNAVLTLKGSCFAGDFGEADNPLTVTVEVGEQTLAAQVPVGIDHSYEATVTLSGLDYTCAHTLTITAQDRLGRVVKTLNLPKGEPVFDWGENDFQFHVPVSAPELSLGGVRLDYIVEQGTSDIWTYRKWNSGIAECWARKEITTDVTHTWGSLYTSGVLTETNLAYPFAFVAAPNLTAALATRSAGAILMVPGGAGAAMESATQTGAFEVARGVANAGGTYVLNYHAKGRWK